MPIHTVLGPIDAHELRPTGMREHVLLDGRVWVTPSPEPAPEDARVTPENFTHRRWNYLNLADNLVSPEPAVLAEKLACARRAGTSAIVDPTVIGLGRRPHELPEIARRGGVHLIVGCGFDVHDSPNRATPYCDCGVKTTLMAYGGHGNEHLLRRIAPTLERHFGVAVDALERMLVRTPRRLLDRRVEH